MRGEIVPDLHYAARGLLRNRTFTAVAILSLALGIGATTSVFSVVDRILFRSLPFADSDRLVSLGIHAPALPYDFFFGAGYLRLKQHPPSALQAVTSWTGTNDCDLTDGDPVRLSCAAVASTFLATLGVAPVLGRSFSAAEDSPHVQKTVLLSYGLWRARFGQSPAVLEKIISLDGQPARIVGVLPRDFETPTLAQADLLIPQQVDDAMLARAVTGRPLRVIARLSPGAGKAQVQAEGEAALAGELQTAHSLMPKSTDIQVHIRSLRDLQGGDAATVSRVLLAMVFAVLLLACANVVNLLLARSFARRREMAIRTALGAGRLQLLRLAITEGLLLACTGGVVGVALAFLMLRALLRLAPEGIPRLSEATLDPRILGFTLVCCVAVGLLFGIVPAMRGGGRIGRPVLVTAQFALSLALLTGAGLLGRALWNFQQKPLGMETQHVLTASLSLSNQRYPRGEQQLAFAERLENALRAAPELGLVAIADSYPPNMPQRSRMAMGLRVDGRTPDTPIEGRVVWRAVGPEYFHALGIRILSGRSFTEDDRTGSAEVAIVSESLARRLFGTTYPLGHFLGLAALEDSARIVGVAQDVRNSGGTAPDDPEYYVPRVYRADASIYAAPDELRRLAAIVRTPLSADAAARVLRQSVASLDGSLPVEIASVAKTTDRLAVRPRFNATLLGLFAMIGLALAAFGLYGVLGFLVVQRTREIGVRMAIGASPGSIVRLILATAGKWLIFGLTFGLCLSVAVASALRSLLLGVSPFDPAAWVFSATILLLTALAAAWVPSRRAAAVDPMEVLRHE
jgi:putative ABC transport system permease protein